MSKFNKEDFPLLFATVASKLGEEEAEKQLSIAWEGYAYHGHDIYGWDDVSSIAASFIFGGTLQGEDYWLELVKQS